MPLASAQQDLRDTTLKAISGGLNKLQYLVDLRDTGSSYSHWGLSRTHGEQAASKALAEEHRELISTLLATPVRILLKDVQRCSEAAGIAPAVYLEGLCAKRTALLLPPEPSAGSERHLNSVLRALSELVKSQSDATRPI
jgi:hypothetical protein